MISRVQSFVLQGIDAVPCEGQGRLPHTGSRARSPSAQEGQVIRSIHHAIAVEISRASRARAPRCQQLEQVHNVDDVVVVGVWTGVRAAEPRKPDPVYARLHN